MFLVVLILLSVAAYFLFHAFRDWQAEQGVGYQRAGALDSNAKRGASTSTGSGGKPAGGYTSSRTGKQTTNFREAGNSDNKQGGKGKSSGSPGSGSNTRHDGNKDGSSAGQSSTRTSAKTAAKSDGGSSASTTGRTSGSSSNRSSGVASGAAQSGQTAQGSGSSSKGAAGKSSARTTHSGAASTASSSAGDSSSAKPAVTKETLRFTNRESQADDLKKISGIGPSIEKDLNSMGIYNFKQLADFQQSDIDNVNTALDFAGRIERDDWVPQAKKLVQGGATGGAGARVGGNARTGSTTSGSTSGGGVRATSASAPKVTRETLRFTNRESQADDLKLINGIGPSIEKDLNSMGVYNFKQVANFQQSDIDNVNTALDFPGRIERDEWVPQAKRLMNSGAAGGTVSSRGSSGSGASAAASSASGSGTAATKETLRFTNRESQADNLQLISGVGPVIEQDLNSMGIYNFSQIANFQQSDIDNVNTAMDFPGRIERDEWLPQARRLMQSNAGSSGATGSSSSTTGSGGSSSGGSRGGSSWAAGSAVTTAAVAGAAATAKSGAASIPNASTNTPDALAGEIKERIKILNLRQSDAKRLAVSPNEFDELAAGRHANLGSEKLQDVTKILRWLCDEQL